SQQEITLQGEPGARLPVAIEVSTQEKRPVWAHASSNVPWLEVSRAKFNGKTATISMSVPTVPNRPGETLEGELTVIANGNQRWNVPVRLEIAGAAAAFDFTAEPAPPPRTKATPELPPLPVKRSPPPPPSRRRAPSTPLWLHIIPAVLLGLAVLGVVGF